MSFFDRFRRNPLKGLQSWAKIAYPDLRVTLEEPKVWNGVWWLDLHRCGEPIRGSSDEVGGITLVLQCKAEDPRIGVSVLEDFNPTRADKYVTTAEEAAREVARLLAFQRQR